MTLTGLDPSILAPAMLAGLLVLATHVPLGAHVLKRGIVFIDLAIAQIAGLGVIGASYFGWDAVGWAVQLAAVCSALLGALLLNFTEQRWPQVQEALIGVVFILAASGGILLLAGNPHGGEHLQDLLVGQILWVSYGQLLPVAALTVVILILWFGLRERLGNLGFYLLFALAVTASVQLVGVYLVFASLIIPALVSRFYAGRNFAGYFVGAGGYALGLLCSALFDLPSGAVIIWSMAILGLATAGLRRRAA
ncbi:MAG: metal ABC transporter permease [Gammaproteobacteria bacterium]